MNEFTKELIARTVAKLCSVRVWATLIVIITLCWSVGKCFDIMFSTVQDEAQFTLIKDIVMFILGSFTSVVSAIVTLYFTRSDRWKNENEEGGTTNDK